MGRTRTALRLAAALAIGLALPASAQAETCELHVWAYAFKVQPAGAAKSNLFVKVTPYTGSPLSVTWLMEPAGRAAEMDDAALVSAVRMPAGTTVVRHSEFDTKAAKKSKVRLIPGSSECYADLFFEIPSYWPGRTQSDGKERMVGNFVFRRFGPEPKPQFEFKAGGGVTLIGSYQDKNLTESRAREIARQASADLIAAFAQSLERKLAPKK